MRKYVDNSKADKARRKTLVSVGVTTKAKAKELLKKHSTFHIYGVYLDGTTEIGVKEWQGSNADKYYEIMRNRVLA